MPRFCQELHEKKQVEEENHTTNVEKQNKQILRLESPQLSSSLEMSDLDEADGEDSSLEKTLQQDQ